MKIYLLRLSLYLQLVYVVLYIYCYRQHNISCLYTFWIIPLLCGADQSAPQGHALCGKPPDPQLLSHYCGPLQLLTAPSNH